MKVNTCFAEHQQLHTFAFSSERIFKA